MSESTRGVDLSGPIGRGRKTLDRYVNHDDVVVAFVSLWLVVATIFTVAWVLSYYLLAQGLLRGTNPVTSADYAGTVSGEFLALFGWNVAVSAIAVGANTLRSVNTPLGYVMLVVQAPRYGAVWGTGSLAVGTGDRIAPSLAVLVERSGPMEITAMVAVVVATRGLMIWHQASGPRWKETFDRVQSPREWSVSRREWGPAGRRVPPPRRGLLPGGGRRRTGRRVKSGSRRMGSELLGSTSLTEAATEATSRGPLYRCVPSESVGLTLSECDVG